jgi:putative ABC transport system permease protein
MLFNASMNAGVVAWARSEWRRRWGALLLLALVVGIAGGTAVAAVAASRRTETAFDRLVEAVRAPNIEVSALTDEGFSDLDLSLLSRVREMDGVNGYQVYAFVAVATDAYPSFFAIAVTEQWGQSQRPLIVDGREISSMDELDANEVVVNEAMRDAIGRGAGDTVELRSLTSEQFLSSLNGDADVGPPAGPTITAHVVAVGTGPEEVSDAPDPFFTLPPAFLSKYQDEIWTCRCIVAINADPAAVDSVVAQLHEVYPSATIGRTEDLEARLSDTVALQRRAWLLVAIVAMVAGGVALYQATSRFMRSLLTDDSTRGAIGMTSRDRQFGRFLMVTPAVVTGTASAVGVAYLLSSLAPVGITRRAEPEPGRRWDASIIVPGVVVVLVASLALCAMSAVVIKQRETRLGAVPGPRGPVSSLGSSFAFGPGRGAILGVAMATAGLVGGLTLQHSIDHLLRTPALYGADFDASSMLDDGSDRRAVADDLAADPDIEAVGLVWVERPGDDDTPVQVIGPNGSATVDAKAIESVKGTVSVRTSEGRAPVGPDEVALGRSILDELGADVGDRITAIGSLGSVELTIVGDNLDPGVDLGGSGFAVTVDGLMTIVDAAVEGAVLRLADGADSDAVLNRHADAHLQAVTPPSEVGNIGQLGGLPGRVGQLLALLGAAALINGIVLTLRQGRRQLAIHRALGLTRSQVLAVHFYQGTVVAICGLAIGGAVGFVVGRQIERTLVDNVGAIPEVVVPASLWTVAIGTMLACLAAAAITGSLAARRRPGVVLRAE